MLFLTLVDPKPLTWGLEAGRCTEDFIELNGVKTWGKRRQHSILLYFMGGFFPPISTYSLDHTVPHIT